MASPLQIASLPSNIAAAMSVEAGTTLEKQVKPKLGLSGLSRISMGNPGSESPSLEIFAHGVEFVALPGQTEKLQREVPLIIRGANAESDGFYGCLVLFSEQEARLVTVITFWRGSDQAKQCDEKRCKKLLGPYVDRWLRVRRFVSFLSVS